VAEGPAPDDETREDLRREIASLRDELARTEEARARLQRERDRLQRERDRLKDQLDAARRAGFRQAAPFAKAHRQGTGRPPGRRAGASYGRRAHRARPRRIDETHDAALPPVCPGWGDAMTPRHIATQYQEDLPPVRPVVRAFRVAVGTCRSCGRRVQGRHPLQTSDALGAAGTALGPRATALGVWLHKGLGLPLGKVRRVLATQHGLAVTRGGLVHLCARTAARAAQTYAALCAEVRGSPVVTPDETGWKVGGTLHWLWVAATPTTTIFRIAPGRGFDDAAALLGADFAGILVRDGWVVYRRFTQATHQTCLAHLLRRCRLLRGDHPRSRLPRQIQGRLQQALALRDRGAASHISPHGLAVARGRLLQQILDVLTTTRSTVPDVQRFAAHLTTEAGALLTFLGDPAVDATNWRAEHAIRPAVVTRKVCGGNRTARRRDPADPRLCPPHPRSARPRPDRRPHAAAPRSSADRRARPAAAAGIDRPAKPRRLENGSQNFTGWNQLDGWLRQVDGLRLAA
jgi:transposase